MDQKSGMNYAPKSKFEPVVAKGEFVFSVAMLKHGHIYGMTNGLLEAGATIKYVYDDDIELARKFADAYPGVEIVENLDVILQDPDTKLVASAHITSERGPLGCLVMKYGKDYFTDKAPFTTLEQLEEAKKVATATKQKFMVYYSEHVHVESSVYAKKLIDEGAIGKVIQVIGLGPHRLSAASRPQWFFEKEKYGGILCDIGSHQIYQYLLFADLDEATIEQSHIANYSHPQYPELDDFGDANLLGKNGSTFYFRVDWYTPDGLTTWGDGRTMILGTEGYIEIRKYVDLARDTGDNHIYLVNHTGESYISAKNTVGFPFFREFILDCINRTENAMTQHRAFLAAELSIKAQNQAIKITHTI